MREETDREGGSGRVWEGEGRMEGAGREEARRQGGKERSGGVGPISHLLYTNNILSNYFLIYLTFPHVRL